jgi:hypothetical protein
MHQTDITGDVFIKQDCVIKGDDANTHVQVIMGNGLLIVLTQEFEHQYVYQKG